MNGAARVPPAGGLVLAALALVALIALATRGEPVWQSIRVGATDRSEILLDVIPVVILGLLLVLALGAFVHRAGAGALSLHQTMGGTLAIASVALACLTLVTIARLDLRVVPGDRRADAIAPVGELPGVDRPSGAITDGRQGLLEGEDRREEAISAESAERAVRNPRLVSLALVAIALAAMVLIRRKRKSDSGALAIGDEGDTDADLDRLRGAMADTIDAMLADPDPHRAIIGAYARLLEALAAEGVPRREHEGPLEHLRRVFLVRQVRPRPLQRLIALFEIARFSTRPLTAEHREQALAALRSAAADLEFASSTRPSGVATGAGGVAG